MEAMAVVGWVEWCLWVVVVLLVESSYSGRAILRALLSVDHKKSAHDAHEHS
jgi:hypothetical protein